MKFFTNVLRRIVAAILLPVLFLTVFPGNLPVMADETKQALSASPGDAALGKVAPRHLASSAPTVIKFTLPANPTTQDLRLARLFNEPLFPVGGKASSADDAALATALLAFSQKRDRKVMEDYIAGNQQSPWLASVLVDVGLIEFQDGYFTTAINDYQQAWNLGKNETDKVGKLVIDRAVAELIKMYCRVGQTQKAESLLSQVQKRPFRGMVANMMHDSIQATRLMDHQPKDCFKCGPYALWNIAISQHLNTAAATKLMDDYVTTKQGVSLSAVQALSSKMGLKMQMAKRVDSDEIPLPCVVHWKLNHYGALLSKNEKGYQLVDPTFGVPARVSADAIAKESDGYFLVPAGSLPSGWVAVGQDEAGKVFGRGRTGGQVTFATTNTDCKTCPTPGVDGPPASGSGPSGGETGGGVAGGQGTMPALASWSFHIMLPSLHIQDTPVGYTPPLGSDMHLTVTYDHREMNQPSSGSINYSNFGPLWNFNWMSTVIISSGSAVVTEGGGGSRLYEQSGTVSGQNIYYQNRDTSATLVEQIPTSGSIYYEVDAKDGSKMIYGLQDTSGVYYLTQIVDSKGNAVTMDYYTGTTRLHYVTDALGQQTTFQYLSDSASDPGYYLITKVTDPFGRYASFTYSGGQLQSITDAAGNLSQFSYGVNAQHSIDSGIPLDSFISTLQTPYGSTNFSYSLSDGGDIRTLTANEPGGAKQMVMGIMDANEQWAAIPSPWTLPPNQAPTTGNFLNTAMNYRDSFYWDRKAMSLDPGDWKSAHIYHFFHDGGNVSEILEAEKPALESWIWYAYQGENAGGDIYLDSGELQNPTQIGRVLDSGVTQLTQLSYNSLGNPTQYVDPLGRTTNINYYSNGIDIQNVQQMNGANADTLAAFTWNTISGGASTHQPLTYTDRAGETTHYSYYPNTQLESVTNAKGQETTLNYTSGYLTSIQGPEPSGLDLTTLGYADTSGNATNNVTSVTNGEGYQLKFAYDALDRVTKTTYPDGTYRQNTYTTLDVTQTRDRQGRLTNFAFNGLDQMTSMTDANGYVTKYGWCSCGSLKSITDGNGHVTRWDQDMEGRPIAKTYADGTQEITSYESGSSRVHSVKDAKGQVKVYTYNADDTLASISYANAQNRTDPVKFGYDSAYNRVTRMQDGIGVTNYSYYPITGGASPGAGRVSQVTGPWSNSTVAYTYDELGRVLSRSINGVSQSYQYDILGRVGQVVNALGTFNYTFENDSSRVSTMSVPNGEQVKYTYLTNTGDCRLSQIQNLKADNSNISTFGYPSYNAEGSIATWNQTLGSSPQVSYSLGYDNTDELTSGSATGSTYGYTYDPGGNRLTETINGSTTTAACNSVNQVQQLSPAKSGDKAYQWDAEDRLVGISYTGTGQQTKLSYDGFGRCAQIQELNNGTATSTRRFLWCELQRCEERDAYDNVTKRFFNQGEQIWKQGYYFLKDHLGSVMSMTDSSGAVRASYKYDFWGRQTKLSGDLDADLGFTGLFYHQASTLCLAVYRAYDSSTGRWLSRDPIAERGGINLYGYVQDDPVSAVDPLGLQTVLLTPVPPEIVETAIKLNDDSARVNLPDGRAVDLFGRSHFDKATQEEIRTPHTHCPNPPNPAPYDQFPSGLQSVPRPSTLQDILDAIEYLLEQNPFNSITPPLTPTQQRKASEA